MKTFLFIYLFFIKNIFQVKLMYKNQCNCKKYKNNQGKNYIIKNEFNYPKVVVMTKSKSRIY